VACIYAKFHDNPFRHVSDINVSINTICDAVMLVLLKGGIPLISYIKITAFQIAKAKSILLERWYNIS
jgi:hypothetical protein